MWLSATCLYHNGQKSIAKGSQHLSLFRFKSHSEQLLVWESLSCLLADVCWFALGTSVSLKFMIIELTTSNSIQIRESWLGLHYYFATICNDKTVFDNIGDPFTKCRLNYKVTKIHVEASCCKTIRHHRNEKWHI